jgi:hypothetical protein
VDGIQAAGFDASDDSVGAFRQGTAESQWALGRYLVGRAVAEALGRGLLILAVALLVVAGLAQWADATFWTIVIVILAVGVLLLRSLVLAVLRRLSTVQGGRAVEQRLGELVADTRKDVLRELRRLGLPGRSWTLPLLAFRLIGKRRQEIATKLRGFEVDQVVPAARLDELHLLLRSAGQGPVL